MRFYLVAFCVVTTFITWNFNYSANASPNPKLFKFSTLKDAKSNFYSNLESFLTEQFKTCSEAKLLISSQSSNSNNEYSSADNAKIATDTVETILQTPISRSANDLLFPPQNFPVPIFLAQEPEVGSFSDDPGLPPGINLPPDKSNLDGIQIIRRPKTVQLQLFSSFNSDSSDIQDKVPVNSTTFINQAGIFASPELGTDTRLVAYAGTGLVRFFEDKFLDYNTLSFSLGVRQKLANNTYGQLEWVRDRFYATGGNSSSLQDLVDNSIQLTIDRRDNLTSRLLLSSFYQLRSHFSEPVLRSRITNSLGANLSYGITDRLVGALDYRVLFDDFTRNDRFEIRQQLSAIANYQLSDNMFIAGSASYLLGASSFLSSGQQKSEDFNNFSFGINFGLNLPLF